MLTKIYLQFPGNNPSADTTGSDDVAAGLTEKVAARKERRIHVLVKADFALGHLF